MLRTEEKGKRNFRPFSLPDCSPDPTVVRRHCKRRFLRSDDSAEIKIAAVKLFDIVAADWKPERYCLIAVARVDRNKSVRWAIVAGE